METLREGSKRDWAIQRDDEKLSEIEIQVGCLQRIADAVETMASRNDDLISQINWFKEKEAYELKLKNRLIRQVRAYKGLVKTLKQPIIIKKMKGKK